MFVYLADKQNTIWGEKQIPDFEIPCQQYICQVSTGSTAKQKSKEIMRCTGDIGHHLCIQSSETRAL